MPHGFEKDLKSRECGQVPDGHVHEELRPRSEEVCEAPARWRRTGYQRGNAVHQWMDGQGRRLPPDGENEPLQQHEHDQRPHPRRIAPVVDRPHPPGTQRRLRPGAQQRDDRLIPPPMLEQVTARPPGLPANLFPSEPLAAFGTAILPQPIDDVVAGGAALLLGPQWGDFDAARIPTRIGLPVGVIHDVILSMVYRTITDRKRKKKTEPAGNGSIP